jgi:hypothetical protein
LNTAKKAPTTPNPTIACFQSIDRISLHKPNILDVSNHLTTLTMTTMNSFLRITSSFLVVHFLCAIRAADAFTTPSKLVTMSPIANARARTSASVSTKCDAMIGGGLEALDHLYQTAPYCAAFVTCSVKASAADLVAQTRHSKSNQQEQVQERNDRDSDSDSDEFDFLRNLAFVLYGGFYQGMGQTFLYSHLFPKLFGTTPTVLSVLGQASFENFILAPFFCLPTVYTMKALLAGGTPADGISKYIQHISTQHVLYRYWSIWFPVQCLNFAVVPEHLRVPFGACISFFWICLLSSISAREGGDEATVKTTSTSSQAHKEQPQDVGLVLEQAMTQAMERVKKHPLYQQLSQAQWAAVADSRATALSLRSEIIVPLPAFNQTLS